MSFGLAARKRLTVHKGSWAAMLPMARLVRVQGIPDVAEMPDLSARGDNSNLAEDNPCDPTTTSKPEAPMQSLNQLPVVTDLADARSA
jgi:hypothetical protein